MLFFIGLKNHKLIQLEKAIENEAFSTRTRLSEENFPNRSLNIQKEDDTNECVMSEKSSPGGESSPYIHLKKNKRNFQHLLNMRSTSLTGKGVVNQSEKTKILSNDDTMVYYR